MRECPAPYTPLTPAQRGLGRLLVGDRRWRWSNRLMGVMEDGSLLEVRGYAVGGLLPQLGHPQTAGHLLQLLHEACEGEVAVHLEYSAAGAPSWRVRLSAGPHRRSFAATTPGEALAHALLARWAAVDRILARTPPPSRRSR